MGGKVSQGEDVGGGYAVLKQTHDLCSPKAT